MIGFELNPQDVVNLVAFLDQVAGTRQYSNFFESKLAERKTKQESDKPTTRKK